MIMRPDYWRQLDFYNPSNDEISNVLVVGAGSIGSYTAFGFARLGVRNLMLVDFDKVESHNLPNQFFSEKLVEAGYKTEICRQTIREIMPTSQIEIFSDKIENFRPKHAYSAIAVTVDSMEVRKYVWENFQHIPLYLDARVGGLFVHIYAIKTFDRNACKYYGHSLHTDAEALELPCTARSVVDVSMATAAELVNRYRAFKANHLTSLHTFYDYKINDTFNIKRYEVSNDNTD